MIGATRGTAVMSRSADRRELAKPQDMIRKSRFFSSPVYAAFGDDVHVLLGLPAKKLATLLAAIPLLVGAPEPDQLEKEFAELGGKLGISGQEVYHCVRVIRYSLLRIQEDLANPDEPSLWANDFIALFGNDPAEFEIIHELASRLLELASLTLLPLRTLEAARKIFPCLLDTYTSVELRGVFREDYSDKWAVKQSLELQKYTPELIGTAPVASVSLSVDIGNDFQFQVDESGLRRLIRTLLATVAELEAVKSTLKMSATTSEK
jgi:hypothetical protein